MTYDLITRTKKFAIDIRNYVLKNKDIHINETYYKQVLRSSSSIGANYIEANDTLSKKRYVEVYENSTQRST